MLNSHRNGRFPVIGRTACHHLIHHNAKRIQVASVIHPAALGLLRGNVMNTSQCFLSQGVALAHDSSNAEVRHLHRAILQHHHIVGLNISVDDSAAVGMLQGFRNLHSKVQSLLPVQRTALFQILLQGDAFDQLHDDIVCIICGRNVVHLYDIGIAQHSNRLALRTEAAAKFLVPCKFVF